MRKLTCVLCAAALIATGVAYVRVVLASPAEVVPTPDFIAAGMKDQEKPGMALEVRYPWKTTRVSSSNIEIETTIDTYYVRTPKFIYRRREFTNHADPSMDIPRVYGPDYTTTSLYNRTTREYRELRQEEGGAPPQGRITYETYNILPQLTSVESVVTFIQSKSLYSVVEEGTMIGKRTIDGHDCWGVSYTAVLGSIDYVIWVDPEIGFCPRRIDLVSKGMVRHSETMREYEEIAKGVWFPMEVVETRFDKDGKQTWSTDVKDIKARLVPLEEDAKLKLDFPPGTIIRRDEEEKQTP